MIEDAITPILVELPKALGAPEKYAEPLVELSFGINSLSDTIDKGAKLIAAGASPTGVGVAYYVGDQVAGISTKYLERFSGFLMNSYMKYS